MAKMHRQKCGTTTRSGKRVVDVHPMGKGKASKPRERRSPAHYKGWTLVERLYARYAIKGADAVRVCPLGGAESQVIEAFRRKVDELEGSSC